MRKPLKYFLYNLIFTSTFTSVGTSLAKTIAEKETPLFDTTVLQLWSRILQRSRQDPADC